MDRQSRANCERRHISQRANAKLRTYDVERPSWRCQPVRLPQGFRLTKPNGDHAISAVCEVRSHPDGWELRMVIDGHGLLLATVEASAPKMLARVEKWRTAMLAKSWSESHFGHLG